MSFFQLPYNSNILQLSDLEFKLFPLDDDVYISSSTNQYVLQMKEDIEQHVFLWDTVKKVTNPYEYIHTSYVNNQSVCKKTPLSRSYYKMLEMMTTFHLVHRK